jgi:amino acid adenylation domain-containing protein
VGGLFFLEGMPPANATNNLGGAARTGARPPEALERALQALVDRHPALRTTFSDRRGEPVQRVSDRGAADLRWEEAGGWTERELHVRLTAELDRPFDLEGGPLLRLTVLCLSPAEQVVTLAVHHLVADFWSLGVMVRELGALYRQETGGPAADLGRLPLRYTDVVRREQRWLASPAGQRSLADGLAALGTELPVLDLATDRPRPSIQSFRGTSRAQRLGGGMYAALESRARSRGSTLFVGLLVAFGALLHRLTGQERILVGSPVAGRGTVALDGVVGYFVNPVVMPVSLTGNPTFLELLDRVRDVVLSAFERSEVPFPLLAERLQPERDPGRPPVFQAMLVLQKARLSEAAALAAFALGEGGARLGFGDLVLESLPRQSRWAQLDLTLSLARTEGDLVACLEVDTALFDAPTAARMLRCFETLLRAAVADPACPAAHLALLAPQERDQLLVEWNDTGTAAPEELCLHHLFQAQAERAPEATALVHGGERLSYRQLDDRACRLARRLRALGIGPEVRVAVLAERSPRMVVALLAILEAGGCYVPLDPSYPRERLSFMLEDSGAALLLAEPGLAGELPAFAGRVELLGGDESGAADAARLPRAAGPGNLAYLIYTSGSTGRPKAVAIEHRSPLALMRWAREAFAPEELAGVLAATSICFDLSVFELFVPLSWGGTVVLARNVLELPDLPAAGEVTLVNTVPSALAELVRTSGLPPGVRTVNLAGEPLPGALVRRLEGLGTVRRVLNLYGPSEDTTYSTWAAAHGGGREPAIGRPLPGTRAYGVDARLEPVPIGVPGEILLGGAGLARGYLGRPELTAERFVPDPWSGESGARLYRTGDLARALPSGEWDYLGRRDHQVKVRGFRIELGEVEAALAGHPAVREAVVAARPDAAGHAALTAWVVPAGPVSGTELASTLRRHLRERLPAAMVPGAFVTLPDLPRTPSGKLDRRALPAPAAAAGGEVAEADLPRTAVEELLAGIWGEVLGRERIGSRDSFFDLGGHSLLAMQVVSRARETFRIELPVLALFEEPTLAGLAGRIERMRRGGEAVELPVLGPASRDGEIPLPLSFAQQRLWFLQQLEPESPFYNVPVAVRLSGRLDASALAGALAQVVRRHATLRTRFLAVEGRPVQEIADRAAPDLPVLDLSGLPQPAARTEAQRLARSEPRQPFDLGRAPLLRARLLRLAAEEHTLLLTLNHLVADGWSMGVLAQEISALYGGSPLPELPCQYADFAGWQRAWLEGGALARQMELWKARLTGVPALELPADRPRPAAQSHRGARCPLVLPPGVDAALTAVARRCQATRFMVLLAAFQALLSRLSGQDDIAVGSPVAGRHHRETEGLIGLFVNTVVLRTRVEAEETFEDLLARVREVCLEAYTHQGLPFEKLVEELQPERSLARAPLFQVLFALQADPQPLRLPGVRAELLAVDPGTAKFDLTMNLSGLSGYLEYSTDLFEPATVARIAGQWQWLLAAAAADPRRPVGELSLPGGALRHQLLTEWNDTDAGDLHVRGFHELFAEQVRRAPEDVALIAEPERLSYRDLDRRSNRLAHRLLQLGAGPGRLVALYLERSADFVAGILASHKAGAAYLPLDPAFPPSRIESILADAEPAVLVTCAPLLAGLAGGRRERVLCLDRESEAIQALPEVPPATFCAPEMLAYVIYTSGSTGRPKGVAVEHRHLLSYVRGVLDRLRPPGGASWAVVSTLAADLGHTCVFPALATGGCLHVVARERAADPAAFAEYCRRHPIDCLKIVPSHMAALELSAGEVALPRLRLILGGEACSRALAERLRTAAPTGCVIFNHYGPTETTVGVTACPLAGPARGEGGEGATVPLGRPLADTRAYVVGPDLRPVPLGVPGELLLGGGHVARGYVRRPDLTADRFLPDPFGAPGERLYRSGDLVRSLSDGSLEFLGRIDRQVKIRGFRIELGEIESALVEHPEIRAAVVEVREDRHGERRLVAWVVGTGLASARELEAFLARRLPEPMVPGAFVALASLPLTANGKVDRKALPLPPEDGAPAKGAAPRHPVEELLAGLWAEVLGRERVGIDDDFFRLGGHSLLAMRLMSRIRETCGVELPLRTLFEAPSVEAMAERIAEASTAQRGPRLTPIAAAGEEDAPLSFAQQRLWFLDQLEPDTPTYNLSYHARFQGPLQHRPLELSLGEVVRRHAVLRTTFPALAGAPVQRIAPPAAFILPRVDLTGLPAAAGREQAARLSAAAARQPFDLAAGPLLRGVLVSLTAADHLLLLDLHHMVCDAWSRDLLASELAAAYEAFAAGRPSPLGELPLQYADFARWQRQALQGEALEAQLRHWQERLRGPLPVLELPADRPRTRRQGPAGDTCSRALAAELMQRAERVARQCRVTPFMLWLAAFQVLLHRYSGQPCVIVGTPIANRGRAELEALIGFFVNTLPVRADLSGEMSFTALLEQVRSTALAAYSHQDLPFERLIEELQVDRAAARTPLFQSVFLVQSPAPPPRTFSGLVLMPSEAHSGTAKFDLTLAVLPGPDGLAATAEYSTGLFDRVTVDRLLRHFETLLTGVVGDPGQTIERLPLLPAVERLQVVTEWSGTATDFPRQACIHELVAAEADRAPDAVAVCWEGGSITYRELVRHAHRLACHLRALGVGAEASVGVCLERGPQMPVTLLAILAAGGAYLPLDPALPAERLRQMLAAAGAAALIVNEATRAVLPTDLTRDRPLVDLDWDAAAIGRRSGGALPPAAAPESLAYVLYTSGSTGVPKGIAVTHRSVVRLVRGTGYARLAADEVFLQLAPVAFDASTFEIWGALLNGARLVLPPSGAPSVEELGRTMEEQGVTTLWLTAGLFQQVVDAAPQSLRNLRQLLAGGDVLPVAQVRRVLAELPGVRLINGYGPTENTTFTCCFDAASEPFSTSVPIGRPIANTRAYVVDGYGHPVPIGVSGELWAGGDGLARGYLGRPDLTAERFVPDPFGGVEGRPGERLYRTGDRVRYRPSGSLEFLGRMDAQVKVRGFRIEPGEIETVLASHPAVEQAVVVAHGDGPADRSLVAYLLLRGDQAPTSTALREYLAARLPRYSVPAAFVRVDALPLSPNGKIDRRRLPSTGSSQLAGETGFVPPSTAVEIALAQIWTEALQRDLVGIHDNFFELGGHSLLATRLVNRYREVFAVDLPLRQLFETPTIAELGQLIEAKREQPPVSSAPAIARAPRDRHRFTSSALSTQALRRS